MCWRQKWQTPREAQASTSRVKRKGKASNVTEVMDGTFRLPARPWPEWQDPYQGMPSEPALSGVEGHTATTAPSLRLQALNSLSPAWRRTPRLIRAERVCAQRVARVGVGPGPRSAADVAVFARAAIAVKLVGRMQSPEDFRVPVYLYQRTGAHIAATQRQESGRIDVSQVRDEDDAVPVPNLKALVHRGRLHLRRRYAGGSHLFDRNAAVGRRFRRLDRKRRAHGEVEHPAHDGLAFFRSDFVKSLTASDRNQKEQAPAHHRETGAQQIVDGGQIVRSLLRHQRVDLDRKSEASAMPRRFHSAFKRSGYSADVVVLLGTGAVETESQALNAMLLQTRDGIVRQFRSGAGRDRNFQPQPRGIVNQRQNILTAKRITSRQDQVRQGIAKIHQLLQEELALLGIEFQRMRIGHGLGAAVFAGQAAGLGHLPVHQHRILGKVTSHAAHIRSSAGNHHDFPLSGEHPQNSPHKQVSGYFLVPKKTVIRITLARDGLRRAAFPASCANWPYVTAGKRFPFTITFIRTGSGETRSRLSITKKVEAPWKNCESESRKNCAATFCRSG